MDTICHFNYNTTRDNKGENPSIFYDDLDNSMMSRFFTHGVETIQKPRATYGAVTA